MKKSTEQAVFVLLMLALQKNHTPVRSHTLAEVLDVSDSYLKKVLKTMVNTELIRALPGREGGFTLARPIQTISYGDVFQALEGIEAPQATIELARAVYDPSDHLEKSISAVQLAYERASTAFLEQLNSLPLSHLLLQEAGAEGLIDWQAQVIRS